MSRLERLEEAVAQGPAASPVKAVPTDSSGRATIGGRARRDSTTTTPGAPSTASATAATERHPSQASPPAVAPAITITGTGTGTDDDAVAAMFERQVRPALRGMAKAIYMGAHVGTMSNGALQIRFAGEPHRVRAEEYRGEVERALAAAVGRHIPLTLVVDPSSTHDDNVVQLKRTQAMPADEDVDTGDLVDVPPDAVVSPIDRLAQAFPGSEIIEERT
jgi:DNA polymerase-3 subunit gamma/tau